MTSSVGTTGAAASRRAAAVMAVLVSGFGVAGCSVVNAVKNVTHAVQGNKAIIEGFASQLKSGVTTFEATYQTTGANPATVIYAVKAPNELLFKTSFSNGTGSLYIVANAKGEYVCAQPNAGGLGISCSKLPVASTAAENRIFSFYTPAHWVAFLRGFALAAGLAGDKVSSSTMSLNGFNMQCVDFRAPGVPGTSRICTAAQGILGYVKVAGSPNSFELKSYTATPADSLFVLPPGAKVTTTTPPGA